MSQARLDNSQSVERMPPQAVEVEQAVLGAMFIDQSAIGRAGTGVVEAPSSARASNS